MSGSRASGTNDRPPAVAAASCPQCLAWGLLYAGYCRGCYDFRRRHRSARCTGCGHDLPLKQGYCRSCWLQAALQAQDPPVVTGADLAGVRWHQLFFAGMNKMRGPRSGSRRRARPHAPTGGLPRPVSRPADGGQLQLHLPGPGRAFDYELHAEPANPCLRRARRIAAAMGQARGWNRKLVAELDRGLVICLSGHAEGVRLSHSALTAIVHRYGISVDRLAEVLSTAGLLDDDRTPAFEHWADDKLAELAPGIAADVRGWVRVLAHGGPRSLPRRLDTVRLYLRSAHPVLLEWSSRYTHLREVTTVMTLGEVPWCC